MNNKLQVFKNPQFGEIRTIIQNDEPWFVGKDVAEVLGYSNPRDAISKHVDKEDKTNNVAIHDAIGRERKSVLINESGLYSLILSSKLPNAKQFKRWVTNEVLPTIRKTGGYVNNADSFVSHYFPGLNESQQELIRVMLDNTENLNRQIEEQKPKVLFADAVSASDTTILVGEMAKLLKQNHIEIGQNASLNG